MKIDRLRALWLSLGAVVFCLIGAMAGCAYAAEPVEAVPVAEPKPAVFADTVWLERGGVKLGLSPSVGRITWFGWSDGPNLIWVNRDAVDTPPDGDPVAWVNYGGDKVWPSPQPLWPLFYEHGKRWPPDGQVDGEAWEVVSHDAERQRLVIRSPRSDVAGVRITRELSLDGDAGVSIRNEIERVSPSPLPIQAWSVTQVMPADDVKLAAHGHPQRADGDWLPMVEEERFEGEIERGNTSIRWTPSDNPTGKKLGTTGRWIAAKFDDTLWVQTHRPDPSGAYPENSNVQLYVANEYIELELLSAMEALPVGRTLVHEVRWRLRAGGDEAWQGLERAMASQQP